MKQTMQRAALLGLSLAPVASFAAGEPLNLTATGTEIAGYVATAGTAGLIIAGAIWGLRIMIKGFKAVAK